MTHLKINKILVPIDFSKTSLKALDYATSISLIKNAEIILLHVSEGLHQNLEPGYFVAPTPPVDYTKYYIDESNRHLGKLAEKLKKNGVIQVTTLSVTGIIHKEILSVAKEYEIDLIVMGTHGVSGITEFFVGSNTFRVIRNSECPVLSVQEKNISANFKTILVPFTDRPHSREKVNYAIDFAKMFSSEIFVLGIDEDFTKQHRSKIELEAKQIQEIIEASGLSCNSKIVSENFLGDVVLNYAKEINADLVISSDLDREGFSEYLTGPFSQQIVNHSPIPVLSIHPRFNTDSIDLRFY